MKRTARSIYLIVFICIFLTGCNIVAGEESASTAISSVGSSDITAMTEPQATEATISQRMVFDLSEWLSEDANELKGIPWFSSFTVVYEAMGLKPNDLTVFERKQDVIDFIVPVYLEPFGIDAFMILRFLDNDAQVNGAPIAEEGTALREVYFLTYVEDQDAFRNILETYVELADRPALPLYSRPDLIDTAVENWRGVNTSRTERVYNERWDRYCTQYFNIEVWYGIGIESVAQELGNPKEIAIRLWYDLKPLHGTLGRTTQETTTQQIP